MSFRLLDQASRERERALIKQAIQKGMLKRVRKAGNKQTRPTRKPQKARPQKQEAYPHLVWINPSM